METPEIDDWNDHTWRQQELDEQAMLSQDPGYLEFLRNYEVGYYNGN